MARFARLAIIVAGVGCAAPSVYGSQCNVLEERVVQYTAASCEGGSASSCRTVLSVALPEEFLYEDLTTVQSAPLDSWLSVMNGHTAGLTVVHHRGESEEEEGQEHPGLHYSLDSRIMKLANRSRMLQVQVLYGADEKFVSRPTHGWREGERPPIHLGGHHVELEIMFCEESTKPQHGQRPDINRPRQRQPIPILEARKVDVAVKGEEDVASGDRVAVHNLRGREEHVQSPAQTGGRMHSVNGNLSDHSNNQQRKDKAANHITGRRGHDHGVERALQEEPEEEEITCDPYNGGDELCTASISDAQARALEIQGTSMYCSRECDSRGALWCHIFGKTNCRMCSEDCTAFCDGTSDCDCHPCPESGATETWTCAAGNSKSCYDQIGEGDYLALSIMNQRMTCDPDCLDEGGFWCNAMGIEGCRFCAMDCNAHCSAPPSVPAERPAKNAQNESDPGQDAGCSCIQCPQHAGVPESPLGEIDVQSCADQEDGDAFCLSQLRGADAAGLADKGLSLECHPSCFPGEIWPTWCFAEKVLGCRYCSSSCDDLCGEGVDECDRCYKCGRDDHHDDDE